MTQRNLEGRIAVVTGASGILCTPICRDLARRGARVALLGRRLEPLQRLADEIAAEGGSAIAVAADVTDADGVRAARERVREALGRCSLLVNGAGGNQAPAITSTIAYDPAELEAGDGAVRGFFGLDLDVFADVVEVNIMGTVVPSQAFGEDVVRAGGGSIVNFASMNSYRPLSRVGAYGAAKAGVRNFTEWLAAYLAPANVRVNAIAPGFFVNDRSRRILMKEDGSLSDRGANVLRHTPLGRFGEADELLGCFNWLVDDRAAAFVTGITVPVDGGFLACSGV